jgi:hypothetical protein
MTNRSESLHEQPRYLPAADEGSVASARHLTEFTFRNVQPTAMLRMKTNSICFTYDQATAGSNASSKVVLTKRNVLTRNCFSVLTLVLCLIEARPVPVHANEGAFEVRSNLRAGVAKVDITPRDVRDFEVTGHRRKVTGVRDPLRAGVLMLNDGDISAAIVTLNTIGAWDEKVELSRRRIEEETGVPAANVMVAASHNHSGPNFNTDIEWGRDLIDKLGKAAKEAATNMRSTTPFELPVPWYRFPARRAESTLS